MRLRRRKFASTYPRMIDFLDVRSLRAAREAHNITVKALSDASGVSESQIFRIEGGMNWRLPTAQKLDGALRQIVAARLEKPIE